jgi:hypothetical protein
VEYKKKAIANRTIGLQRAIIEDSFIEEACNKCDGKGIYKVYLPSASIRNLKSSGQICLENECTSCTKGVVRSKIRIIRKNKVSAIM